MRDDQPAQIHRSAGDGSTILIAHETVTALASFYGPKGDGYASLMRDGLSIAQNREDLTRMGMALYDVDPVRRVPSIMNTRTRRT
uniref:phage neck terminator protein n=1 Tax=Enterobacter hormaechei TaxID=158836 RepID=UPI003F685CE4